MLRRRAAVDARRSVGVSSYRDLICSTMAASSDLPREFRQVAIVYLPPLG